MKELLLRRYPEIRRHLPRDVTLAGRECEDAERQPWHQHQHGHVVMALRGVVRVLTPSHTWTLPSSRALWLPPNTPHELHAVGRMHFCTISIEPGTAPWLWPNALVLTISPLLRELTVDMLPDGTHYAPDSRTALSVPLLMRLVREAAAPGEHGLPLPSSAKLLAICEHMMTAPATDYSLERWGEELGASGKTLARRFKDETGMTFGRWCQHMRASEAITRLAVGASVGDVALALGYRSPSAFIVMFKRLFGRAPQQYLAMPDR
ncbi:AraC family transcriptional regulator [Pandoraea pnomenusa]|uniref:AraC family transcriptional regulator n=2 Tax=Pandoraea pnomenusa TaxID=93220 RepID=A0A378YWJ4_9BURK|nr:helix-turn-helix transcriptional regulator [Pandoraea pnomenusa]AHB06730.1 AraC family transcriptional regulator [Pandoraea pnomenusa 3kgm]AHN74454.1 AraC family transcriptional regulator [Pandoraea pnomenusa]AIU28951.1 AraC family transcriptional regulator [Pandoraea pnomenusa]MBN9095564.1 helix-turn-helix transcriptional regulator [Pandoraea pnomenusa]QDH59092.1 AraC family transcriptional regulator [Pandoraea pnomenusa]